MKKKIVLDTSIIIDGEISKRIDNNEINENHEIIIPLAVIDELQSQACKLKEHGTIGLIELKNIREKSLEKKNQYQLCGGETQSFRNKTSKKWKNRFDD